LSDNDLPKKALAILPNDVFDIVIVLDANFGERDKSIEMMTIIASR
jgi:hypothetical protein